MAELILIYVFWGEGGIFVLGELEAVLITERGRKKVSLDYALMEGKADGEYYSFLNDRPIYDTGS